jgi:transcriptional regulator with GAF, ATPase, and Fis domain
MAGTDRSEDVRSRLYDLAKELLSLEDLGETFDAVVRHSLRLLGAERGFLVLLQGEGLSFEVVRNWSPEEYEGAAGQEPISRSILSEVLARREPLLIEDASADLRFQHQASIKKLFIRSVLAAPLSIDGKPRGALYLESRSMKHFFRERELSIFREILELSSRVLSSSLKRLLLANRYAERDLKSRYRFQGIITRDVGFLRILESATHAAASGLPVLIQGPSGTGKELIAQAIHQNSPRPTKPFLTVNCAALSASLLESELFGHVKGAFTGASANKAGLITEAHTGTLFLDEISELPKELQVKLLRTLQFGEVTPVGSTQVQRLDVRFVAATNRDLEREVRLGNFREDLFYRLNAMTLVLPPLKDRRRDILPLFYYFLKDAAQKAGREPPEVEPPVEQALEEYSWPGNIRELENETRRLLALTPEGAQLSAKNLSSRIVKNDSPTPGRLLSLAEQERELIELHLRLAQGIRSHAAESLGISREGLRKMMKRYGLD